MTALEMLSAALAAKKVTLLEQQAADPDIVLRLSFPNPVVNLMPATMLEGTFPGNWQSKSATLATDVGATYEVSLDAVLTKGTQCHVKIDGATVGKVVKNGRLVAAFTAKKDKTKVTVGANSGTGNAKFSGAKLVKLADAPPVVVEPPPVVVEPPPPVVVDPPPPVVVPPPPVEVPPPPPPVEPPPPPVVADPPPEVVPPPVEPPPPPPVAVATVSITRGVPGSTIKEGAAVVTRITVVGGKVGHGFDLTLDNSPLSESDFVNPILTDAANGLPNGIKVASAGSRTLRYLLTADGDFTFDLIRPTKLDLTTEGTEQVNAKLTNPVGGIAIGPSLVSSWVADVSLSPPYEPPAPTVTPSPLTKAIMRGVNLAGAEFGGTAIYPRTADLDWVIQTYKERPIERVPFKMARALKGGSMTATSLEPVFVKEMTRIVNKNDAAGVVTLIDAHDYGRMGSTQAGDGDYNATNARRWWRMIADLFPGKKVMFDLQNEPHDQDADKSWAMQVASAQGVRDSGHLGHVVFAHLGWAGISQWQAAIGKFLQYTKGIENCLLGFHSYPDKDSSGGTEDESLDISAANVNVWVDRWAPAVAAARAAGLTVDGNSGLFVGEFGCGIDENSLQALANFRVFMDSNQDVVRGYTWWAAGPWGKYIRGIGPGRSNAQVPYLV